VIGRVDLIDAVLDRLSTGATVSLVGEAGIGKTTVWRACVERYAANWSWVTSCSEPEQDLGLAVLTDLFAAVPAEVVDRLPPPQRGAVDVVLFRASAGTDVVDERLLGVTTASLIDALAQRGRVLLAMDDLHWCDPASLAALRFALRRTQRGLVAVLTARRGAASPRLPGENSVEVGPLDPQGTARLIRDSGLQLRPRALARVVEVSQGNPLYAYELARAVPPTTDVVRLPPSLSALLSRRFDGLPGYCRRALLDVAVRGAVPDDVILSPAHERGIVRADGDLIRFTHPLFAEATRAQATPAELRSAHRRAADATSDPVARSRHRALAATAPDGAVATALDGAVRSAQQRGDITGARDLAELALAMTPDGARPIHRVAALARCEGALANDVAAHELAEELVERATAAPDRFLGLTILARVSPVDEAIAHIDAATRIPGLSSEARLQAIGEHGWLLYAAGRNSEAGELLESALATARPDTREWAEIATRLTIVQRKIGIRHDPAVLHRAVELDRQGLIKPAGMALEVAAHIATYEDRHDDARRLFTEAAVESATRGDGSIALDVQLAHLELRFGNLSAARAAAERINDGASHDRGQRDLGVLAQICAWQGDLDSARRAIEAGRRAARNVQRPGAHLAGDFAEGLVALFSGKVKRAWALIGGVADTLHALGVGEPSAPGVLPIAVEVAAAAGEIEQAEVLCARLEEQTRAVNSAWGAASGYAARGHIALVGEDTAAAVELFDHAAAAFGALDLPLEQGRALLAAGSTLRAARATRRGAPPTGAGPGPVGAGRRDRARPGRRRRTGARRSGGAVPRRSADRGRAAGRPARRGRPAQYRDRGGAAHLAEDRRAASRAGVPQAGAARSGPVGCGLARRCGRVRSLAVSIAGIAHPR
jgi:tetratricopeptide (TPR) repeat protein